MLCDNCGKREANVRYSENINGRRKELNLCEECSQKLGITNNMNFNMPIDFSSFFGEFMEDFATPDFMPLLNEVKTLQCDECGYTFDDIVNTGKLGCGNCYSVFEERLDPIIKRIQGSNKHVGRIGKIIDNKISQKQQEKDKTQEPKNQANQSVVEQQENKSNAKTQKDTTENQINNEKQIKLEKLQEELKQAIKEERYEDAAKIRDQIKNM